MEESAEDGENEESADEGEDSDFVDDEESADEGEDSDFDVNERPRGGNGGRRHKKRRSSTGVRGGVGRRSCKGQMERTGSGKRRKKSRSPQRSSFVQEQSHCGRVIAQPRRGKKVREDKQVPMPPGEADVVHGFCTAPLPLLLSLRNSLNESACGRLQGSPIVAIE